MSTILISNILVIFVLLALTARGEADPKIIWGKPVQEWSLGISTTNAVYPEGVPPQVSVILSNGASVSRRIVLDDSNYRHKIVWSSDSGEITENLYPYPFDDMGYSARPRSMSMNGTAMIFASCANILARLPPGQGRLMVIRSVKGANGWEELYSGDLVLHVRPRIESDPPPLPRVPITKDEFFAKEVARGRAALGASNAAPSNLVPRQSSPAFPATLNKSGTPSIVQKSGNAANPVIGNVSAGESPGSIFTPRNIIASIVVLGLLAIIASVLVRARSRQNSPP